MTEITISISPHAPISPQIKSRRKRICRLKQNTHSCVCYQVHFIHSRTVTGKKAGRLVCRLSYHDTPNCAGSAHCCEKCSAWAISLRERGASQPGQCRPGLLRQGQPSTELAFEVEMLLFPRRTRSRWVASALLRRVFTVWWPASQSCWWCGTLEDTCTGLCSGSWSYPGGVGQARSAIPSLIQPPKRECHVSIARPEGEGDDQRKCPSYYLFFWDSWYEC